MTNLALRSDIDSFQHAINCLPEDRQLPKEAFPLKHYVTNNGLYAREIILPANTVVVGKIKKHEYISIISSGLVTEVSEAGQQHIRAPYTMVCEPGTKRVVWAHTTAVWVTIHAVEPEEQDLDAMYDYLVASSYEEVDKLLGDFK